MPKVILTAYASKNKNLRSFLDIVEQWGPRAYTRKGRVYVIGKAGNSEFSCSSRGCVICMASGMAYHDSSF